MSKKKSAANGKTRSTKRSANTNPEMDVLQERFNSLELDFSALATMLPRE